MHGVGQGGGRCATRQAFASDRDVSLHPRDTSPLHPAQTICRLCLQTQKTRDGAGIIGPGMSAHQQSPMRLLAPAALAVFAIAFLIVVIASLGGDGDASTSERPAAASERERDSRGARQRREPRTVTRDNSERRFYVVRAGDNLALIAEKTGVTLEQLRLLNPDLDPQGLVTGQRVRLRAAGTTGATGATGAAGSQGGGE
jgi:hypothetical protein